MKRLIFFLLTATFVIISFLSIKQFEYIQFQNFNYDAVSDEWNVMVEDGDPNKSKHENFELLIHAAMETSVNLQRISYERDIKNNKDKIVYYVAFSNANQYFEKIKLKSGEFLDNNSTANDFLSTVQTDDTNQVGKLEIFHSFEPIEIRPMIAAAKTKDIKGNYTLNGQDNAKKFMDKAIESGLIVQISKEHGESAITEYPYQNMISKTIIILCLFLSLAILYDVMNNYKEIAVRYMFGYSFIQIGFYLFRKYIRIFLMAFIFSFLGLLLYLYFYNQYQQILLFLDHWFGNLIPTIYIFLFIFAITWLSAKSIDIPQMIKNKKPMKLLFYLNIIVRFIIAIFLILGLLKGIGNFIGLKGTFDKQDKWSTLKDYAYLGVKGTLGQEKFLNLQHDKEMKKQVQLMYKDLESMGSIYINPSNYYLNDSSDIQLDPNPWGMEGRKVEINKNYVAINPIFDIHNKQVKIPEPKENEIIVLVPDKLKGNEEDIKISLTKDYEGAFQTDGTEPIHISIIYVKDEQSYFTYSTNMAQDNNYEIEDPIAVIVNDMFDPTILANSISMGFGYYIKMDKGDRFYSINKTIKRHGLSDVWEPTSIAYSNVELKIANELEELQIAVIYCGLSIILIVILLFFTTVYYLEINKQSLAIQWIFGYNFFEKHSLVYLSILVFWNVAFTTSYVIADNSSLLIKIVVGLTAMDIVLTSILIMSKEYTVTKNVLLEK